MRPAARIRQALGSGHPNDRTGVWQYDGGQSSVDREASLSGRGSSPVYVTSRWVKVTLGLRIVVFATFTVIGLWATFIRPDAASPRILDGAITIMVVVFGYRSIRLYQRCVVRPSPH
jgi:hypothetical protein